MAARSVLLRTRPTELYGARVLFERVVETSAEVAATSGKKKKVERIAALLTAAGAEERAIAARYLSGEVGHKLGIGYATVAELRGQVPPATAASLTLVEVDQRLAS